MSNDMIFPNPNKLTELLLYGNPSISDSDNNAILNATLDFISTSNRFS